MSRTTLYNSATVANSSLAHVVQANPVQANPVKSARALTVRAIHPAEVDEQLIRAWAALEGRCLEGNAYLSPHFMLPALKHLSPSADILIVLVESGETLLGLGVFEAVSYSDRMPSRHLRAYRSIHTYLTGVLLDQDQARPALQAMLGYLCEPRHPWHGIEFTDRPGDGPLDQLLHEVAPSLGMAWTEYGRTERPTLLPAHAGENYVNRFLHRRAKDARRRWRRLAELGPVSWTCRTGSEITAECIERFLELENLGWKKNSSTSLLSSPSQAAFFRETARAFAAVGNAVFTELSVAGKVIASTSNFCSGMAGFAFKLGWHPDYAVYSPGLLNELELIRAAPQVWGNLEIADSGSSPGSFMENIWLARRTLVSGMYATDRTGRVQLAIVRLLRGAGNSFPQMRRLSTT